MQDSLALRNGLLEKEVQQRAAAAAPAAMAAEAGPAALPPPPLVPEPSAAWRIDAATWRQLQDMLGAGPTLRVTVLPGPPLTLTGQQVGGC